MRAAGNELRSHLHRVEKGRASGGKIESPRSLGAQLGLHHASSRGKKHVWSHRPDNDGIYVGSSHSALRQRFLSGLYGEIAGRNPLGRDVALGEQGRECGDDLILKIAGDGHGADVERDAGL